MVSCRNTQWLVLFVSFSAASCMVDVDPTGSDLQHRDGEGHCTAQGNDGANDEGDESGAACVCPIVVPFPGGFDYCSQGGLDCYDLKCGKEVPATLSDCAKTYSGDYCGCLELWVNQSGEPLPPQFVPAEFTTEQECMLGGGHHWTGVPYYEFAEGDTPDVGYEIHRCCG